jgi:hypothetical protein
LFEGAVKVEIQAGELADAEFVIDFDAGVDFFAAIAVGFKANARFEELDFGWDFRRRLDCGFFLSLGGSFLGRLRRYILRGPRLCSGGA